MSKIRYSKDCKQVATAFLDASNCGCQECGAMRTRTFRWRLPLLSPWRKTIRLLLFQSNGA